MATFDMNKRGGFTVDRDSLHASDGYKRQVEALRQLPARVCCPACRGYRLEACWCHLCNGRGYVEKDKPNER